jgi:hypothetical protein
MKGSGLTRPEMLFGIATALGLCRDGELGQCAAHYIMGSAFIGYAAILVIMLNLGGKWLERRGVSQEMLDSWVIMLWVSPLPSRRSRERLLYAACRVCNVVGLIGRRAS